MFMGWTYSYFRVGFWRGFAWYSTYPHLMDLIFYLSGKLTLLFGRPVGETLNIALIKAMTYSVFAGLSLLLLKVSIPKKFLIQLLMILFLLNPAIVINASVLAYTDSYYIFSLILCLFLLYKIEKSRYKENLAMLAVWVILIVSPFLKWQFLVLLPVLSILSLCLAMKKDLLKSVVLGIVVGVLIVFLPLVKTPSLNDIQIKTGIVFMSFYKITHERFVTADFSNVWQLVQYFRYNNLSLTSSPKEIISHITERTPNWVNYSYSVKGRSLFFFFFAIFLFTVVLKIRTFKKIVISDLTTGLVLWSNFIYVMFNTAVHENHFMPTVAISAFIFAKYPSLRTFILYSFLTIINFANLSFFYGLSEKGFFGIDYHLNFFGLNLSILIAVTLVIFFLYQYFRLLKTNDSLLGWK